MGKGQSYTVVTSELQFMYYSIGQSQDCMNPLLFVYSYTYAPIYDWAYHSPLVYIESMLTFYQYIIDILS